MQETEETGWMVIVRWKGGRDKKPPPGNAVHERGISEQEALRVASAMQARLPRTCSTVYRAEPMPSYLS